MLGSFAKLIALLATATTVAAQIQSGVLFPLYIYPFQNTVCGGWTRVVDAATSHPDLPFWLVINPDSGPGLPQTQPNFDWTPCIPQLRSASSNVHIIGYVHTNYGAQTLDAVNTNITTYAGWSSEYRPDAPLPHKRALLLVPVLRRESYSDFNLDQLSFSSSTPASKQAVVLHHGPSTTDASLVNQLIGTDRIGAIFLTDAEYTSIPGDWDNFVDLVQAAASA
ncbi:hypothetical protein VNI00_014932 [Paramarasmius palmivorus]|uniref:Spherulin-4 n=1 Tax=Paramarasmius palmivorus TaxID=297713 RepID=A0AAW0BLX4_9AGAR